MRVGFPTLPIGSIAPAPTATENQPRNYPPRRRKSCADTGLNVATARSDKRNMPLSLATPRLHLAIIALTFAGSAPAEADSFEDRAARPFATGSTSNRTIKSFDFDEERLGNFEPAPMNWQPIISRGFPPFQRAVLDKQFGHANPPSMRLSISVGSAGAAYTARDIPIDPGCDYRVRGWIRTDRLRRAAATIRATLLDQTGAPIAGSSSETTARRSADTHDEWTQTELILSGDFPAARFIQISALVVQPDATAPTVRLEDTYAGAWFDDITIDRLPRVAFVSSPGKEILSGESPELTVSVHDADSSDLSARVTITDTAGRRFLDATLELATVAGDVRVATGPLPAGWYRAILTVASPEGPLASAERVFIRDAAGNKSLERSFIGLTIPPADPTTTSPDIAPFVTWLAPGALSLPLAPIRGSESLLARLHQDNRSVVGRLDASNPTALTDVIMRYGPMIDVWRISSPSADATGALLPRIRRLAGPTPIAMSCDASTDSPITAPAPDILIINVPDQIPSARIPAQLAHFKQRASQRIWAELATPRSNDPSAIADWTRRVILARQAGAEQVFVPAPWKSDRASTSPSPEPHALALRALSALIGNQPPLRTIDLDDAIHAVLFASPGAANGTLVAWADDAANAPRRLNLPLGAGARAFDTQGQPITSMNPDSGFWLTDAPTYITGVSVPELQFADAIAIEGLPLEVGRETQTRTLRLNNPTPLRLEATLKLTPPTGWQLSPKTIKLTIAPNAAATADIEFRLPRNAPAGSTPIPIDLAFESGPKPLHLQASARVGLADLDVRVLWRVEGGRLVIQQLVTNLATKPVSLRAVVRSPNHPRETRSIENLDPGRTAIREFVLDNAASLIDHSIRVTLARAGGTELANHIIRLESSPGLGHER